MHALVVLFIIKISAAYVGFLICLRILTNLKTQKEAFMLKIMTDRNLSTSVVQDALALTCQNKELPSKFISLLYQASTQDMKEICFVDINKN